LDINRTFLEFAKKMLEQKECYGISCFNCPFNSSYNLSDVKCDVLSLHKKSEISKDEAFVLCANRYIDEVETQEYLENGFIG
jgi:hypothetical protein